MVRAYSADYADSFSEYRIQIKNNLNVKITNTTWISDSTLNDFIRASIIKVSPIVRSNKTQFKFTTRNLIGSYSLDTTVVGVIDVAWSSNNYLKVMMYAPKSIWYTFENKSTIDGKDVYAKRPSYYDYIDGTLFLYPVPTTTGDTVVIDAYTKITSLSASDNLDDIPQVYRTAIVDYATYLAARSKQHPDRAMYYQNYLESVQLINQSVNRRGLSVEKSNTATP